MKTNLDLNNNEIMKHFIQCCKRKEKKELQRLQEDNTGGETSTGNGQWTPKSDSITPALTHSHCLAISQSFIGHVGHAITCSDLERRKVRYLWDRGL